MICPGKICRQEIPDDSLYCDQCGIQILRCVKCGNPGTGKFCGKCGGAMVSAAMNAAVAQSVPEPFQQTAPQPATPESAVPETVVPQSAAPQQTAPQPAVPQTQAASPATVIVPPPAVKKLLFCHPDGWNMEIAAGDILGRTNGSHTDRLGAIPVISGTHAQITFEDGAWYITDQNSTNKTYIGGLMARSGVPVKLKNNDVVQLANVRFIVREP